MSDSQLLAHSKVRKADVKLAQQGCSCSDSQCSETSTEVTTSSVTSEADADELSDNSVFREAGACTEHRVKLGVDLPCGTTTVMIRRLPSAWLTRDVVCMLDVKFKGEFDYVYVPVRERNGNGRGFAFVNFLTSATANKFYQMYHERIPAGVGYLPALVQAAAIQGYAANVQDWQHKCQGGDRETTDGPFFR